MERRISVGLSAVAMWGLALLPSDAIGQQKSVSEQLLGTWSLVSFERTATNPALLFAAGFLVRPLGGWLFGYLADHHGRRGALMLSVSLMCFGSLMIAATPMLQSVFTHLQTLAPHRAMPAFGGKADIAAKRSHAMRSEGSRTRYS